LSIYRKKAVRRRKDLKKKKALAEKLGIDKKYANHLKRCSCYACGNPRTHWGEKPIQEKRLDIHDNLELDEAAEMWPIKQDSIG